MGVESNRVPPLPAPTETESTTPTELLTDLATDVSIKNADDKSSYVLPEDGTPVTIKARGRQRSKSQTSLLIEYFEHSKAGSSAERKPSVRVRLTPSSKSRENDHHIQITKTKSSRKATASRRIPLSPTENGSEIYDFDDGKSMSSYASATEESNVSRQIEVDIDRNFHTNRRQRRPASPLIPAAGVAGTESRTGSFMQSEVSAIPTDSFLDGTSGQSKSSGSPYLPAEKMREKSSGRERPVVTAPRPKERDKEKKHKSSKSRSTSVSRDYPEASKTSRRPSRSHHQDSILSGADSSVLSSQISESMRSGTSKASSINNPKLLETVEDAIRRLILPELNALKREQSKRGSRPESLTASTVTSVASTEDVRQKRRSTKSTDSRDTARHHESRNREARNDLEDTPRDFERESIDDSVLHENEYDSPKLSNDKLKVAAAAVAAAAAVGAASSLAPSLAPSALSEQTSSEVSSRRRRRSAKKSSRSTEDTQGEFQGGLAPPVPPMPLSSEINASDITRTSILSAPTDSPHSATEEVTPVQQISRGAPAVDDDTPGPLRTPGALDQLGAHHANVSRGDLRDLPKQRTGEFPKGIEGPVEQEEYEEEEDYDHANPYSGLYTQDVPAPLNYVPYQPASRGLSPIESVSGYTDGHSEIQPHQRDSRLTTTTGSFSPTKSPGPHMDEAISNLSAPSNVRTHDFDDRSSLRSSALGYRNTTYTEDSEVDRVQSGQAVQLLGANPNYVNSPVGVESNVASLVDGSAVDASLLSYGYHQQQSGSNHDSVVSLDDGRSAAEARGISPGSPSVASRRQLFEDRMDSPLSRKSNLSHEYQEYEPDQYGRKVPISTTTYRQSPTPSETAIADAAVAALKQKAKQKDMSTSEFVGEGVLRNKSFKERVKTREPAPEPKHSVDRFSFDESPKMRATGLPDFHDPLPEIGYGADDHSVVEGPLGGGAASTHSWQDHNRSANATPTQKSMHSISQQELAPRDIVTPVAAGALAGAGAAGLTPRSHARSQDIDDDFVQTSADRKRDTLLTNPYENASPIAVLPGMNPLGPEQYGAPPPFPSGTPLQGKVDEGYISQGHNRTPDLRNKGKSVEAMDPASYGPVDDPFGGQSQMRHMSGLSQGMASPFYDAATGTGIDRIENKDIVALMQHLMVRDAERSARDTEILVSLVRTAADMRNSFNVVTQMLSDVENTIISEVQENTEKTVKTHISGPRPYPGSAARSIHGGSQSGAVDEATARKRNFLKKALKGLTMKGSSDLGRIEDMLMHLLSEVDVLKTQTAGARQAGQSFEHLPQPEVQYEHDRGYEPEGIAGTSTASHASQSGPLSVPQRGPSAKLGYDRRFPAEGNRISTVPEEDDYESQHLGTPRHATPTQQHYSNPNMLMSPTHETRGSSVPLDTPPQPATHTGSMSQEQTPNTPKDKKKHKSSGSSSWFPKISRWSETTASSVGNKLRISGSSKKNQSDDFLQHPPSRSGSALDQYDADGFLRTEPFGDKLQIQTGYSDPDLAGHHSPSLQRGSPALQAPHPATFMTPEDPKYKAHRNSINLMHPQPRQGNTERFKMNLETKAQDFDSPLSPKSADWAGSATSLNRFPENPNHYADGSAAASAAQEYWGPDSTTSAGPPRPPKEPIDDSPTSTRLSKVNKESSPLPFHSVESGYGTATTGAFASPRLENRHLSAAQGVPTRRPSGPRAMTPRGDDERRKRDTFGTVASQESETF